MEFNVVTVFAISLVSFYSMKLSLVNAAQVYVNRTFIGDLFRFKDINCSSEQSSCQKFNAECSDAENVCKCSSGKTLYEKNGIFTCVANIDSCVAHWQQKSNENLTTVNAKDSVNSSILIEELQLGNRNITCQVSSQGSFYWNGTWEGLFVKGTDERSKNHFTLKKRNSGYDIKLLSNFYHAYDGLLISLGIECRNDQLRNETQASSYCNIFKVSNRNSMKNIVIVDKVNPDFEPTNTPLQSDEILKYLICGVVIGAFVLLAIGAVCGCYCYKRRARNQQKSHSKDFEGGKAEEANEEIEMECLSYKLANIREKVNHSGVVASTDSDGYEEIKYSSSLGGEESEKNGQNGVKKKGYATLRFEDNRCHDSTWLNVHQKAKRQPSEDSHGYVKVDSDVDADRESKNVGRNGPENPSNHPDNVTRKLSEDSKGYVKANAVLDNGYTAKPHTAEDIERVTKSKQIMLEEKEKKRLRRKEQGSYVLPDERRHYINAMPYETPIPVKDDDRHSYIEIEENVPRFWKFKSKKTKKKVRKEKKRSMYVCMNGGGRGNVRKLKAIYEDKTID